MQERLRYEAESLREMHAMCPAHVPEVYAFDGAMCVIAMQYVPEPAVVLRHGLLAGGSYPRMPAHAAEFLACTLFRSSALALAPAAFRAQAARFANGDMCALTEQVRVHACAACMCHAAA
jgi:5-methylthioribose kinase